RGVSCIFNYLQLVLPRDGKKPIHIAGMAREVNREEGAHAPMTSSLESFLHTRGTEVEGSGVNVHKHRLDAQVAHDLCGRGEGKRGGYNLIARPQAERPQRQVECSGTVRDGKGVAGADVAGEFLFELLCLGSGGYPPGTESLDDFAFFFGAHRGP